MEIARDYDCFFAPLVSAFIKFLDEICEQMNYYRERIKNAPSVFSIPKQMRNRDVEIIILPLDERPDNGEPTEVDENGYPVGFFEETAGSLPDFPERELQPVQPDRVDI